MLLTINGQADSGKDFVADWCATKFDLVKISFADPMKRFVRQLFGFPAENLWGPSEKRNEVLDAEPLWRTAFSQLHTMHQFTNAVLPQDLHSNIRAKAFEGMQDWFTYLRREYRDKLSARIPLQTLGTEWGRTVSPYLWIDYLFKVQVPKLAEGFIYTQELGVRTNLEPEKPKNGIVIPDLRFLNELEECEKRHGYTTRVRRLSREAQNGRNIGLQGHASEQEQRSIPDSRFRHVFNFQEGLDQVKAELEGWAASLEQ